MKRIIISASNDLFTDQRIIKTCDCFNELGYDILLIGRKLKNSPPLSRPYKIKRWKLFFNSGFLFYAELNIRLLLKLLVSKKTMLYANDLDTLLANYIGSILSRVPLVYDSHEYFTEVPELVNQPTVKRFWENIEATIFPKLKYAITVNEEIAEIYSKKYGVHVRVIKNVPKKIMNYKEEDSSSRDKIIIYQGALNKGRGLELLIDSMTFLEGFKLFIAGDGYLVMDLKSKVTALKLSDRIQFLGRIDPKDLYNYSSKAAIGVSLEEDLGLNYRYSLPNKVFDYIQCRVPIIASNLPVTKSLVEQYHVGEILIDRNPNSLAHMIKHVYQNSSNYSQGLNHAARRYNWNSEKTKLIKLVDQIEKSHTHHIV